MDYLLLVEGRGAISNFNFHRDERRRQGSLCTGASGYIASWIVKLLLQRRYTVHATIRSLVNNSWRGSFNEKEEPPFKKMKDEPSSVIPPKSGGKPGLSPSTPSKIRASASPILSIPEQSGVPLSPLINRNITKVPLNREDATLTQSSKPNASTSEKEIVNRVPTGSIQNKPGSNERFGNKPIDLQSLLISLLMEKPQGMNFKALEKAVGETIPKSVKQIEPILKKIAVFQPTGRYILKPDFELESSRKSLSESGR